MLNVLVVDDSALMRRQLRQILEADGNIVVTTARNGREALERIAEAMPAVVTLDVNMPEMDGLSCLRRIMRDTPCPVVMVSSITPEGSDAAIRALSLGAVDLICKPDGTVSRGLDRMRIELLGKITAAASARLRPRRLGEVVRATQQAGAQQRKAGALRTASRGDPGVVLIGVSTGGPQTLEAILPQLPADLGRAVVVAQHMPAAFTGSFARRLDGICGLTVLEVDRAMRLLPGHIYIGRGDADIVIERRLGRLMADSRPPDGGLWHPSVDRLVRTALDVVPPANLIGVQLTGMGNDGARAMAILHAEGGRTIAESEETATVFGMPFELIRMGGATKVLACDRIARQLVAWSAGAV